MAHMLHVVDRYFLASAGDTDCFMPTTVLEISAPAKRNKNFLYMTRPFTIV